MESKQLLDNMSINYCLTLYSYSDKYDIKNLPKDIKIQGELNDKMKSLYYIAYNTDSKKYDTIFDNIRTNVSLFLQTQISNYSILSNAITMDLLVNLNVLPIAVQIINLIKTSSTNYKVINADYENIYIPLTLENNMKQYVYQISPINNDLTITLFMYWDIFMYVFAALGILLILAIFVRIIRHAK